MDLEIKDNYDNNTKIVQSEANIKDITLYKYVYPYKTYYIFDVHSLNDIYLSDCDLFNPRESISGRISALNEFKKIRMVEYDKNNEYLCVYLDHITLVNNVDWMYLVERLRSAGQEQLYNLSNQIFNQGLFYKTNKSKDILDLLPDIAKDISIQKNINYEDLKEESFINQKELACYFCHDLRPDHKIAMTKIIFTKPLLDTLELNPFTFSLELLNNGLKEIYYHNQNSSYAELVSETIERVGKAMCEGWNGQAKSVPVTLITSKGKLISYQEGLTFFKFKNCFYSKYYFTPTSASIPSIAFINQQQSMELLDDKITINNDNTSVSLPPSQLQLSMQDKTDKMMQEFIDRFYTRKKIEHHDKRCTYRILNNNSNNNVPY